MGQHPSTHLFGTGFNTKVEDMLFDPAKSYRACLICGDVFQSSLDRSELQTPSVIHSATRMRAEWAILHARRHSSREHHQLELSGMSMTPEAAKKLAAFGLLPVSDMAEFQPNTEIKLALLESKPTPTDDAES